MDTHCDTPMDFKDPAFDLGVRHSEGCVDFPRMIEGGLHSEFFAIFIGSSSAVAFTVILTQLQTLFVD